MTAPTPTEIRAWRERLGYTQKQAAEAVGIEPNTWARRERGEQAAPPELVYAMAWIYLLGPMTDAQMAILRQHGLHGPLEG